MNDLFDISDLQSIYDLYTNIATGKISTKSATELMSEGLRLHALKEKMDDAFFEGKLPIENPKKREVQINDEKIELESKTFNEYKTNNSGNLEFNNIIKRNMVNGRHIL